jgi:Cysteine-rich CWC
MSTCNESASSKQQERKICDACGKEFFCTATASGCWCEKVRLTATAREEVANRYNDCLCRNCLEHFAVTIETQS